MNYKFIVHLLNCLDNILQIIASLFNTKGPHLILELKEGSAIDILQNKVETVPVLEETIEFDDIRMVKDRMQLDLLDKLVNHFILDQLRLQNLLQSHQHPRLHMTSQKYLPKFALTYL